MKKDSWLTLKSIQRYGIRNRPLRVHFTRCSELLDCARPVVCAIGSPQTTYHYTVGSMYRVPEITEQSREIFCRMESAVAVHTKGRWDRL